MTACLSFIASGVIVLTSYQGNKQLLLDNTSHYGNIISTQLAENAREPLIQSDKISLQAMLSELTEHPQIHHATIYNLQNQPIAEAGEPGPGFDYSASITFQDSIAGYAVISIDHSMLAGNTTLAWQLLMLSMILTGLVYASALLAGRQTTKPAIQASKVTEIENHDDKSIEDLPSIAPYEHPVEDQIAISDRAFLHIVATNIPSSQAAIDQQQQQAIQWLEQQLMDICQLYDGQVTPLRANSFTVTFYNTDDDSYPFRTLCCACLARQLLKKQPLLVCEFSLVLYRQQDEPGNLAEQAVIEKAAELAIDRPGLLISGPDFIAHHSIHKRVETELINPQTVVISSLKEPYESLLERQLSTLQLQQRQ